MNIFDQYLDKKSKINKNPPLVIAGTIADTLKKKDPLIKDISVVKPGFINIKFKPIFWTNFIQEIIKDAKNLKTVLKT